MAQNFIACDREQAFLMPPDVRDWLPENHLAWFVVDVVGVIDTSAFYGAYRADGHGRAAYQPSMMIALVLYCWSREVRSSRAIERACVENVACRVIAARQHRDHATIARFIVRHEHALGELFGEVLALCADAELATVGTIAIDGTKVSANASRDRTIDYEQIAKRIVEEAIATDSAEAAALDERDDPLPEIVAHAEGRQAWLRATRQRLEQERAARREPIPRSRSRRLLDANQRLEEELAFERHGNACYEAYRARGRMKDGRRFGAPPKPYSPPGTPAGKGVSSRVEATRRQSSVSLCATSTRRRAGAPQELFTCRYIGCNAANLAAWVLPSPSATYPTRFAMNSPRERRAQAAHCRSIYAPYSSTPQRALR